MKRDILYFRTLSRPNLNKIFMRLRKYSKKEHCFEHRQNL